MPRFIQLHKLLGSELVSFNIDSIIALDAHFNHCEVYIDDSYSWVVEESYEVVLELLQTPAPLGNAFPQGH